MEEEEYFFQTLANSLQIDIDLDVFLASSSHSELQQNTTSKNLIKVWQIYLKNAGNTLDVTSKIFGRTDNPDLSQNYSNNGKMLRYK